MHLLRVKTLWLATIAIVGISANYSELGELIKRIHKEANTATVYFIGVGDENLSEISKSDFNIPVVNFNHFPSDLTDVILFDTNAILVVEVDSGCSENEQYLAVVEDFVKRLRVRKFVVVIAKSAALLEEYFQYFTELKFTRIFGTVERVPFAYLPYADIPVEELPTGNQSLPDTLKNLNGFNFRTTAQNDFPRVFWYKDKRGEWTIGGIVAELFLAFLQTHNATFTEIVIGNSWELFIPGVVNATLIGAIDVSMNTYNDIEALELSYPLGLFSWTILVPINGNLDPNQYFIRPFTPTVWMFIGFTFVYITVMEALKDYYADIPVKLWLYFRRTLLKLLLMPSEKQITSAYRFHAQVFLLSFIVGNLYTIHLTSFLTVFIKIKQYETIQDLIDNKVPVMMVNYEWDLISEPGLHQPGFENNVVLVDSAIVTRERNSMQNTSFAYPTGMDKAQFLLDLQMSFSKPTFYMIRDSLLEYYLGFLLIKHSPFMEILNNFIIRIMDTGLMLKWENNAVLQSYSAGIIDVKHEPDILLFPLTIHHLHFAWTCLLCGLTLSVLVFVGENHFNVLHSFYFQHCSNR